MIKNLVAFVAIVWMANHPAAHHPLLVTPPKFQAPACEPPAVLLGVADNYHLKAEQIVPPDLYALESAEPTGWLASVVGLGDLLVVVHPDPSPIPDNKGEILLFVFFRGCFLNVAKMPDDKFRVFLDRTRS